MNLLLLPKETHQPTCTISAKNRDKMQVVMNELFVKYKECSDAHKYCANCGHHYPDETYTTYIFWRKYKFCGEWCRYDTESDIRKSYIRSLRR